MREKVTVPDQSLHEIAIEARAATHALTDLLDRQRKTSRRRLIFMTVLYVPLAMIVASFVTIGTISSCFLGADPHHPSACELMPGYSEAQDSNDRIIAEFVKLQKITERNDRRLGRIERLLLDG